MNFIDSLVHTHVAWMNKEEKNPVIKVLKTALRIIESVGLLLSVVGIPLLIKIVNVNKSMRQTLPIKFEVLQGQMRIKVTQGFSEWNEPLPPKIQSDAEIKAVSVSHNYFLVASKDKIYVTERGGRVNWESFKMFSDVEHARLVELGGLTQIEAITDQGTFSYKRKLPYGEWIITQISKQPVSN